MGIRDLREYIKSLCGSYDIDKLGQDDEPFFKYVNGAGRIVKKVISSVADFASNSEEQLFYEFVQNAYDANSDSLMFYANEKYLIVLNNGKPFYTDSDVHARNGELFSFLAKGASDKNSDDDLGYYGQGSKLLYTLITDSGLSNTRDLLYKAIYEQKKGPYVISWNDTVQLNNLLLDSTEWEYENFEDEKENCLICKVVDSYFPIIPGTSHEYFPDKEYHDILEAFNSLVDPRRNLNLLRQGTAIIIPLGKGQYDKIVKEDNLTKVRTRLGGFSSLTSDKEYNKGKHINHIYVLGEEVVQHEVKSIVINVDIEDEKVRFHFAFNPIFANDGFVNFFKGLPILQAKYNLGFIIDSQAFQLDNSRQRINDFEKTKQQLMLAFKALLVEIINLQSKDKEVFNYVYQSILATHIPDGEDYEFVREPFTRVFLPFLEKNILTDKGEYTFLQNVRKGSYSSILDLSSIGITNKHWVDKKAEKQYKNHKIKIADYPIASIIEDVDNAKLSNFLLHLPQKDYDAFSKEFGKQSAKDFPNVSVYRSNKEKMYSFSQIAGTINVFYFTNETSSLNKVYRGFANMEFIESPVSESQSEFWQHISTKVKATAFNFTVSDAGKECACSILKMLEGYSSSYYQSIRGIELLSNMMGMRVPFSSILSSRLEGTCILDGFLLKGYRPENLDNRWLCDSNEQMWKLLLSNFDVIKKNKDWTVEVSQYLRDIKKIYDNSTFKQGEIKLFLTENGEPTNKEQHFLNGTQNLSESEYKILSDHFKSSGLVPYRFRLELRQKPFSMTSFSLRELVRNGELVTRELLTIFFKIDKYLLSYCYVQEKEGKYALFNLGNGRNYIGSDLKDEASTISLLSRYGYHQIPDSIIGMIDEGIVNTFRFPYNEDLVDDINSRCSEKELLFPIIRKCNDDIKSNYFSNILSSIPINSKIAEEDMVWKILHYAASNDEYKDDVFSAIRFKGDSLPDTIKARKITCRGKEYDLYDINDDYETENTQIETFLQLLPDGEWFRTAYYNGKEEEISTKDVYNKLSYNDLTLKQLEFSLDYYYENENELDLDGNMFAVSSNVPLSEVLDMLSNNDYTNVDNYLMIEGFDKSIQVKAPANVLLKEEMMPKAVSDWLSDPRSSGKITGYFDETSDHIRFRQSILDGTLYSGDFTNIVNDSEILSRTVSWLLDNAKDIIYGSETFLNIRSFIENLPGDMDNNSMPVLEFNGKVKDGAILMSLCLYEESKDFVNVDNNNEFLSRICSSSKLQKFMQSHHAVYYQTTDWMEKHGIKGNKRKWSVSNSALVKKTYKEWDDPIYRKWKENEGITIYTSQYKIGTDFLIRRNKEAIYREQINERPYGYDFIKKFIVVNFPNTEGKKILSLLADASEDAYFFTQPFVRLQQMFLEDFQDIQEEAEKHDLDFRDIINTAIKKANAEGQQEGESPAGGEQEGNVNLNLDEESKKKLEDNEESIKDILKGYSEDELKKLAENPDEIKQKLEDIEEEEEPESQIRQTIGYIGELIYKYYLQDKLHKEAEFAADEGKGEYDFKYDDIYVDVKTNLYSFKGSTVPFYLHISQSKFLQEHPESKYHIVRISLKDLNLEKEYITLRSRYGTDTNPRENEHLKKDCDKIARKYWKMAKIDEFNSLSPEYSIKLEVNNRKHE